VRVERILEPARLLERAWRLAEAREAVEPVVPIMVARNPQDDPWLRPIAQGLEHAIEGADQAAGHLAYRGDGIGEVAPVDEDIAAWQDLGAGGLRGGQFVFGGDEPRDGFAHHRVVSRVRDEIDPDLAPHGRRQTRRASSATRPEHRGDAPEKLRRRIGHHPLTRVHAVGGDGARQEVPEMAPK
jgi:hypothetical protein